MDNETKFFEMRAPCKSCQTVTGIITTKNGQDTVRCSHCGAWQYNAPKDETGKGWLEIFPESLGQFTGLQIQGKNVFEGDIIELVSSSHPSYFEVFWCDWDMAFRVRNSLMPDSDGWGTLSRLSNLYIGKPNIPSKIVGNRFDNPALMEKNNG